jgi:hypothetical protein
MPVNKPAAIRKTGFRSFELGKWEITSWERNGKLAGWIVRSKVDRYSLTDPISTLAAAKKQLRLLARRYPTGKIV